MNDPGRLISTHIVHTSLVSGWAGLMLLYELCVLDVSDFVLNPLWRQGCYVVPFCARLGVGSSIYNWSLGLLLLSIWSFEGVLLSYILLSGLFIISAFWHWLYWDLDVYTQVISGRLVLDLFRIFGVHLCLVSLFSFGFGIGYITGYFGPGIWTSDSYCILGSVRFVKPVFILLGLNSYCFGSVSGHHISIGVLGLGVSVWKLISKPGPFIFYLALMISLEGVLSSSIISVVFTVCITSFSMWYGSVTDPVELFGPTRYQWDNGYFSLYISRLYSLESFSVVLDSVSDKILVYDYLGSNPSKGGLFRSGPQVKGDGVILNWLGSSIFSSGFIILEVRRVPSFFETFPVILIDSGGVVRSDIPFRRSESKYSIEQLGVIVYFLGGLLSGLEYSNFSLVKSYIRKSQFGRLFEFNSLEYLSDGVFRTSSRGWYSFSYVFLCLLFGFGHIWHTGRLLFKDIWTGLVIYPDSESRLKLSEYETLLI